MKDKSDMTLQEYSGWRKESGITIEEYYRQARVKKVNEALEHYYERKMPHTFCEIKESGEVFLDIDMYKGSIEETIGHLKKIVEMLELV
jgi:hypothetical protein